MTVNGTWEAIAAAAARVGELDGRFLALACALQLTSLMLRSVAWRNCVAAAYPDREVPLLRVASAYAAGVAANSFLPARGGEAVKIALLRSQVSRSAVATLAAASSVVLVLDLGLAAVLLGCAWALGAVPALPQPPVPDAGGVQVAIAAVALLAAALLAHRLAPRLRLLGAQVRQGLAVLGQPLLYLRSVASLQAAACACKLGVAFSMLSAFGLPATPQLAAMVMIVGGMSTLLPGAPGGVGTQQVMVVYLLHETVSTAQALAFSVGMQATITALHLAAGLAAAMLIFRTARPLDAVRAARSASRR